MKDEPMTRRSPHWFFLRSRSACSASRRSWRWTYWPPQRRKKGEGIASSTWRSASPRPRRRAPPAKPRRPRWRRAHRLHGGARHRAAARAHRPALPRNLRRRRRARAGRRHDGLVGRLRARLPEPVRSGRSASRSRRRAIRPIATSWRRSGSSPSTIPLTKAEGWIMTADGGRARARASGRSHGVLAMSPANPSGTMIGRDGPGAVSARPAAGSASGSCRTRSITASPTPSRPRRRSPSTTMRS